jgi:hypothetical protein
VPVAEAVEPRLAPEPRPEREGRGPRSRGRRGGGERPAEPTVQPEAPLPAAEVREPRPERERQPRPAAERADRSRPPRDQTRDRGRDRDHDGDDGVVGFGRDIPAFLTKAPPVRSDD